MKHLSMGHGVTGGGNLLTTLFLIATDARRCAAGSPVTTMEDENAPAAISPNQPVIPAQRLPEEHREAQTPPA